MFGPSDAFQPVPVVLLVLAVAVILYVRSFQKQPPPPILWYDDPAQTVHIATYPNVEHATKAANYVAARGWIVQSVATDGGHVNVGRTVSGAVLTGGISLLVGGSRTQGGVTVTYTRTTPSAT